MEQLAGLLPARRTTPHAGSADPAALRAWPALEAPTCASCPSVSAIRRASRCTFCPAGASRCAWAPPPPHPPRRLQLQLRPYSSRVEQYRQHWASTATPAALPWLVKRIGDKLDAWWCRRGGCRTPARPAPAAVPGTGVARLGGGAPARFVGARPALLQWCDGAACGGGGGTTTAVGRAGGALGSTARGGGGAARKAAGGQSAAKGAARAAARAPTTRRCAHACREATELLEAPALLSACALLLLRAAVRTAVFAEARGGARGAAAARAAARPDQACAARPAAAAAEPEAAAAAPRCAAGCDGSAACGWRSSCSRRRPTRPALAAAATAAPAAGAAADAPAADASAPAADAAAPPAALRRHARWSLSSTALAVARHAHAAVRALRGVAPLALDSAPRSAAGCVRQRNGDADDLVALLAPHALFLGVEMAAGGGGRRRR